MSAAFRDQLKPHELTHLFPQLEDSYQRLKDNIAQNGLLVPIVVIGSEILDGRDRNRACAETNREARYIQLPPEAEACAITLICSLNAQREHWNKGQKAIAAAKVVPLIDNGKVDLDQKGRHAKIAGDMFGVCWRMVNYAKKLLHDSPDLAAQVEQGKCELLTAMRLLRDQKAREDAVAKALSNPPSPQDIQLRCGDFRQQLANVADESVSLVLTDPLYDKGALEDWAALAKFSQRVLRPGGFLVAMAGHCYLPDEISNLCGHLKYVWITTLKLCGPTSPHFSSGIISRHRPILIFAKPLEDGSIPRPSTDAQDYLETPGPDQIWHPYGQRQEVYEQLLAWYSQPGDLVIDPFGGGGSVVAACKSTNRRCIATEIDLTHFEMMHSRIFGVPPEKKVKQDKELDVMDKRAALQT